jgi:hypothetical protein
MPSNDKKQARRRISALWALLIIWCLTFFNAARFVRAIPVTAFAIGSIVNFIIIAACVIALRNAYRDRARSNT